MSLMREVHSRMASDTASFSVAVPVLTGMTSAPSRLHAVHVERLTNGVLLAHEHDAFHAHQRRRGRGSHAVLTRTGLGDQAGLAHLLGQQRLSQHVVYLVRAGVVKVFAL